MFYSSSNCSIVLINLIDNLLLQIKLQRGDWDLGGCFKEDLYS